MFQWMNEKENKKFKDLFINSVAFQEGMDYSPEYGSLFCSIAKPPSSKDKDDLSQYFTPADVSLYTSFNLLKEQIITSKTIIFDPSLGKGSLLIGAGVVLAILHNKRDDDLLNMLHGCELCEQTLNDAIDNIIEGLADYIPNISKESAINILRNNLSNEDFLDYAFDKEKEYLVITNPPYKEDKKREVKNIWIEFINKILQVENVLGVGAIIPVSVSCADRTKCMRQEMMNKFTHILALHHEIRPRPLFRGVEQRISILVLTNTKTKNNKPVYLTTGFLTHKSKERMAVWSSDYNAISYKYCKNVFPKPATQDMSFMRAMFDCRKTIRDINNGEDTEFWIRTSGRYKLVVQKNKPEEITSKWSKIVLPEEQYNYIIEQFENGNALKWWRVFGDGRDFSISKFRNTFGWVQS